MEHVVDEESVNRASGGRVSGWLRMAKMRQHLLGVPQSTHLEKKCLQCIVVNGEKQIGL